MPGTPSSAKVGIMRRLVQMGLALSLLAASPAAAQDWAVYYADRLGASAFTDYRLLVFDSEHHPDLPPLAGATLLGYLSVGEVEKFRPWFAAVKGQGLLLRENPNWPGSFMVDLRDSRWRRRVVEDLVPAIKAAGFDGVFLDTLDNAGWLEDQEPRRWAGMRAGAIDLVKAIRAAHPDMAIMVNRAYDLLPSLAASIDMVLAESLFTEPDLKDHTFHRRPESAWAPDVRRLKALAADHPNLGLYSLDYWDPKQTGMVADLYAQAIAQGFHAYVSVPALDILVPRP